MESGKPFVKAHEEFYGGIASDDTIGIEASHAYSRSLDFRKKPSKMSVLPGTREIGHANVVDLIQQIVQTDDGNRYALGDQGFFYNINTSNVAIVKGKLDNGAAGVLYRRDMDEIYMSSLKTVSRYAKISNSPTIRVNQYKQSRSESTEALLEGGTEIYTLETSISESSITRQEFVSDIEPLYSIKIKVVSKGTGDWTITLHDDANNSLGSVTVTNANLTSGILNEFVFTTPPRLLVKPNGRTYHFHVTSTVADGTVACSTAGNLNTCDYEVWADRLVSPNNGFHPIEQFLHYTVIGNERYLSVWEPLSENPSNLEWNRHRLVFPSGYEVCGLAATDEFLVIAAEKKSSNSTKNFQSGRLFIWDGLSQTYNQAIPVPEGSPQGLFTHNNIVYMIINGALYAWPGGKEIIHLRSLADTDTSYSDTSENTTIYPNIMGIRRNVLLFGFPSQTTNQSVQHGVYSWGRTDKNFPNTLGYNYVISTQRRTYDGSNAFRIGCVRSFGDELYISWRDDSNGSNNYGLDIVDNTSDPATTAVWESLSFDGKALWKRKRAGRIKITTEAMPSGYVITPKYKIDGGSWTSLDAVSTTGNTIIKQAINNRFYNIQYGFDITNNSATAPLVIESVAVEISTAQSEDNFNE